MGTWATRSTSGRSGCNVRSTTVMLTRPASEPARKVSDSTTWVGRNSRVALARCSASYRRGDSKSARSSSATASSRRPDACRVTRSANSSRRCSRHPLLAMPSTVRATARTPQGRARRAALPVSPEPSTWVSSCRATSTLAAVASASTSWYAPTRANDARSACQARRTAAVSTRTRSPRRRARGPSSSTSHSTGAAGGMSRSCRSGKYPIQAGDLVQARDLVEARDVAEAGDLVEVARRCPRGSDTVGVSAPPACSGPGPIRPLRV